MHFLLCKSVRLNFSWFFRIKVQFFKYNIANNLNLLPCTFHGETILRTREIGPQIWKLCKPSTQIAEINTRRASIIF